MYTVIRYQIVDHRVYRQAECRFEARCQGIEYFLARLAPVCSCGLENKFLL